MKKTVDVAIGGRSFTLEEDAYLRLDSYLNHFRTKIANQTDCNEVMEDVEGRIAELFYRTLGRNRNVVDLDMAVNVIEQLGMPDGSHDDSYGIGRIVQGAKSDRGRQHRFYREKQGKMIGGVCTGLARYLDIDVTLVRVVFLLLLICGTCGGWLYLILWIIAPQTETF